MDQYNPLSAFLSRSLNDQRISSTHIGVFAALAHYSAVRGFSNPVRAFSYDIMKIAKISALKTYCRCLREMSDYGYLKYEPSKKRTRPSSIYFTCQEDEHLVKP